VRHQPAKIPAFRKEVNGRSADAFTLLVPTPKLRPFVVRAEELEFPALEVMAEREMGSTQEGEQ